MSNRRLRLLVLGLPNAGLGFTLAGVAAAISAPTKSGVIPSDRLWIAFFAGCCTGMLVLWRYGRCGVWQAGHILHVRNPFQSFEVSLDEMKGFCELENLGIDSLGLQPKHGGPMIKIIAQPFIGCLEDLGGLEVLDYVGQGSYRKR